MTSSAFKFHQQEMCFISTTQENKILLGLMKEKITTLLAVKPSIMTRKMSPRFKGRVKELIRNKKGGIITKNLKTHLM